MLLNIRTPNKTETPFSISERRAERRAARRAENRTEILDASERVLGERGVTDGSLRQIALAAGFSPAAIYLFFDNKQHLLYETLARRGFELNAVLRAVADTDQDPLAKLHQIIDDSVAFFEQRPHFRQLLRHLGGGTTIVGPILAEYSHNSENHFDEAMTTLAGIVRAGQLTADIRDGNPRTIAHLYSVLVNEHVLLGAGGTDGPGPLTTEEFHAFVEGALLKPRARLHRPSSFQS